MILLTSTGRHLERALDEGLSREGQSVRSPFTSSSLELLVAAIGCRAIVYTAANTMLAGHLTPRPSATRVRQVLLAAAVPGVELVVGIVPAGDAYVDEEKLLKAGDVPAVVLRCAPLVEELEGEAAWKGPPGSARVTTGEMLSTTVLRALEDTSWRGNTIEVPTLRLDPSWRAPRVIRRSSVTGLHGLPAIACLAGEPSDEAAGDPRTPSGKARSGIDTTPQLLCVRELFFI
ncbi:MAG: hypothetical protein EOO73_16990 [Myxococcales bacterium]|nr:MAG: hypothetical protein EOO73_16990 [Myxococcales bacterium]